VATKLLKIQQCPKISVSQIVSLIHKVEVKSKKFRKNCQELQEKDRHLKFLTVSSKSNKSVQHSDQIKTSPFASFVSCQFASPDTLSVVNSVVGCQFKLNQNN
jgi:hypothetical protein